jgi:hypothetical protein
MKITEPKEWLKGRDILIRDITPDIMKVYAHYYHEFSEILSITERLKDTDVFKELLISELTKIKALTEHLSQDERNEFFDITIKNLTTKLC